jgi:hypothetical protein
MNESNYPSLSQQLPAFPTLESLIGRLVLVIRGTMFRLINKILIHLSGTVFAFVAWRKEDFLSALMSL